MLDFLKNKKNYFVGVDFGTSSVKIVELFYKDGKVYLSNYGVIDFGDESGKLKYGERKDEIVKHIKILLDKMDPETHNVNVAIPGQSGLSVVIEFPKMDEEELAKAVKLEAGKYIPSPLDEVFLSWDLVSKPKDQIGIIQKKEKVETKTKDKMEVLLVAALKNEVLTYEDVAKESDLNIKSLELDIFSIARAFVGEELGTFLIVDVGFKSSNLILVDKGVVKISRSLSVGGNEITKLIKATLNISWKEAEKIKKSDRNFFGEGGDVSLIPVFNSILEEAKRMIEEFHKKEGETNRIDNVIISGGTSKLKGISEHFTNSLGVKTIIGNPWKRVLHKDARLDSKMNQLGASFSVALGLAIKGADDYSRK
ncbi:type IV pilus assembly protein PilM [Patescibacteria group bacterium]